MTRNVAQLFFDAAERNATKAAFTTPTGTRITFAELRRGVEAFAAGLSANGLNAGDRAVCMIGMSPELYVVVLGTLAAGGVAVFVDPWVTIREIARLAAAAKPAVFIGTPKTHLLRLFARELRRVPITVATDGMGASLAARFRLRDFRGGADVASVSPEAPALITYTTGSSGNPKGVNRTHAILAAQHDVIRQEFPVEENDVDLTTFPVFALSNLAAGITTVIPPVDLRRVAQADPRRVLAGIRRHGVTTMAASPPLFDRLASNASANGGTIRGVRRIVTGGAPVRDGQLSSWRAAFPETEIIVAYGSSEAEPVASMTAGERLEVAGVRPGYCVGVPVGAVRTRVVRIRRGPLLDAHDVAHGEIGELLVAGPHVCRDYAGDERAFAENKLRDADGTVWHRMGDTGHFDERGRFWLAGRVHSTIVRGGVEFHPQIIEQLVRADDTRIRTTAAVGVPRADVLEALVIVVESDDPAVLADVRDRLTRARIPADELIVTDAPLPMDPRHNSKIDYGRLRAAIEQGRIK